MIMINRPGFFNTDIHITTTINNIRVPVAKSDDPLIVIGYGEVEEVQKLAETYKAKFDEEQLIGDSKKFYYILALKTNFIIAFHPHNLHLLRYDRNK